MEKPVYETMREYVVANDLSQKVIAINTDPNAPIFGAADYQIVGDAAETLRGLLERLS